MKSTKASNYKFTRLSELFSAKIIVADFSVLITNINMG